MLVRQSMYTKLKCRTWYPYFPTSCHVNGLHCLKICSTCCLSMVNLRIDFSELSFKVFVWGYPEVLYIREALCWYTEMDSYQLLKWIFLSSLRLKVPNDVVHWWPAGANGLGKSAKTNVNYNSHSVPKGNIGGTSVTHICLGDIRRGERTVDQVVLCCQFLVKQRPAGRAWHSDVHCSGGFVACTAATDIRVSRMSV